MAAQFGSAFSSGPGAELMDLGDLGPRLALILATKAVFARDVNAATGASGVSDAASQMMRVWQGAGWPLQHLPKRGAGAIEAGSCPWRASANTGRVGRWIDPWGRINEKAWL